MAGYRDWWSSLQNFLNYFPAQQQKQETGLKKTVYHAPLPTSPREQGDVMGVIAEGARRGVLLWMQYNGNKRYVEPYSYRFSKGGQQLFYAFCHKDQHIEAFRPDRIQDIELTDIPFKPRWPIEIGRSG